MLTFIILHAVALVKISKHIIVNIFFLPKHSILQKTVVNIGYRIVYVRVYLYGFRCLLGSWDVSPMNKGDRTAW